MQTLLDQIVGELELESPDSELPNKDPKSVFSVWATTVTLRLNTKSPKSPTTKSVTCFLNKLLTNWSGTNASYINADRAQRIFYNNWVDFAENGYVDSLKKDLLQAAKWSKDPDMFFKKVIWLDGAVQRGLNRIANLYNVQGNSSAAVKRMHSWAMALQGRSSSILSCYR